MCVGGGREGGREGEKGAGLRVEGLKRRGHASLRLLA
jgi:hypothetical protein